MHLLSDLFAILDPRAVMLTGALGAFVMALLLWAQVKTVQPFGKSLAILSLAEISIGVALLFSAITIHDFSAGFTLRVFLPATIGYALAVASILLLYRPGFPMAAIAGAAIIVLSGYLILPEGVPARFWNNTVQFLLSVFIAGVLLKTKDPYAPTARLVTLGACIFFGLGVLPRLYFAVSSGNATLVHEDLLNSTGYRGGALVLSAMPVLMYACLVGTIQSRIAAMLRQSAHRDALTGAHSRRFLFEKGEAVFRSFASQAAPSANATSGATILMIDIDHFKQFNDTWGHLVGDRVLRHCVNLMQQEVRDTDAIVCRYGGEEFCVLVPEMPLVQARSMADRIRRKIADNPYEHEGRLLPITVSIGVAQQPDQSTLAALIHVADERLFEAKRAGRNRVVDSQSSDLSPEFVPRPS